MENSWTTRSLHTHFSTVNTPWARRPIAKRQNMSEKSQLDVWFVVMLIDPSENGLIWIFWNHWCIIQHVWFGRNIRQTTLISGLSSHTLAQLRQRPSFFSTFIVSFQDSFVKVLRSLYLKQGMHYRITLLQLSTDRQL